MNDNSLAYLDCSLNQINRILSNMDRNKFSPTYGCMHRDYWMYKTSDFPDAVRQFGVHALALVYKYDLPNNIFYKNKKILSWAIAALEFWSSIQHNDGSFDEFYPNERGWVGPTAFTTYTSIESYNLLQEFMSDDQRKKILKAIKQSSLFICKGESEEDHLANHHAMACLAIWKSYMLFNEQFFLESYNNAFKKFLNYHESTEGWSREYDGIDPGYLSATISFLGKIYKENKDKRILEVCSKSIEMCSYFVYPNGFFAGSMGSRNTLHFYSHGFEIFSEFVPLSKSIKSFFLNSLGNGGLVPPSIMSDRYLAYRVPELILSYIDYHSVNNKHFSDLPFQYNNFQKFFYNSKIFVKSTAKYYLIINLAKGGVIKLFNKKNDKLILNDCGAIGMLNDGRSVTSQWIDSSYDIKVDNNELSIKGNFNSIPSNKYFNPIKMIIFRIFLILFGWKTSWANKIKGIIRKTLMLGSRNINMQFIRNIKFEVSSITISDTFKKDHKLFISNLSIGDEFFVRYVPQSRFFQNYELTINSYDLTIDEINNFNKSNYYKKTNFIELN